METKRILYLYREVMPYNIPVLNELVKQGFELIVVHETEKKITPYQVPEIAHVTFLPKKNFNQVQLNQLAFDFNPSLAYVSDRTIPFYNQTAILLRKKLGIPVISGCDTQWHGGKQWFNVFTSWFRHKKFFSHLIVAGMRQFEYAKRLGFSNENILWPMNSSDLENFTVSKMTKEKYCHPRNILFTGRFAEVKGISVLLRAWQNVSNKNGATLTLVGNGPLKGKLHFPEDVIVLDFLTQAELIKIAEKSSCFILPSIFEPWALVIHEFAAAGLPLIVSNACGATNHFVINNYNGFVVKPNNISELTDRIEKILTMDADRLFEFGLRSRELSRSISPKMVAYAITSVLQ
jgi:glycosyltransferase involved in cell wall biosynthesis